MWCACRLPLLVVDNGVSVGTVMDNLFEASLAESFLLKSAVAVVDGSEVMSLPFLSIG